MSQVPASPVATPHKVDVYAVLAYLAGIGGYTSVLTGVVSPDNKIAHTIVVLISSVAFFSGLALRIFFNQTPPGPVPSNSQGPTPPAAP